MNTPSHTIINLAVLVKPAKSQFNLPIVLGSILSDLPIFLFYFWAKVMMRMPERQIWTDAYYQPVWQTAIATLHSIPLALIGVGISHLLHWQTAHLVFLSMILHDLLDLPVHHDDAHRHFFPFSNYRFISPISYYDPAHYATIVAAVEILLVIASTVYIIHAVRSPIGKSLLILVNVVYFIGYTLMYWKR